MKKTTIACLFALCTLTACGGTPVAQTPKSSTSSESGPTQTPKAEKRVETAGAKDKAKDKGDTLKVYISAAAKQCEYTGHPLPKTQETLTSNGIEVYHSECGQMTGLMVPAVCGGMMTKINVHTIRRQDHAAAEALGFASLDSLVDERRGTGFMMEKCKDRGQDSPQQPAM